MRKAAVGAQSRAWSKLDWKTSHACLFCANAEKIDIGLDDRSRRACDARGRAALRHRYFRDRSRRPSQDDFWQFANGRWLAASSIPADRAA